MNWKILKGYILVFISGLAIFAGVVLMIMNGGVQQAAQLNLYGRLQPLNVGLLIAFSALGGIVMLVLLRILLSGIHSLRQGRDQARLRQARNSPLDLGSPQTPQ